MVFLNTQKKRAMVDLILKKLHFVASHMLNLLSLVIAKGWILVSPFYEHKILEIDFPFV